MVIKYQISNLLQAAVIIRIPSWLGKTALNTLKPERWSGQVSSVLPSLTISKAGDDTTLLSVLLSVGEVVAERVLVTRLSSCLSITRRLQ